MNIAETVAAIAALNCPEADTYIKQGALRHG